MKYPVCAVLLLTYYFNIFLFYRNLIELACYRSDVVRKNSDYGSEVDHLKMHYLLHILYKFIYRVIQNDCRGFNKLSYTVHLRQQYVVAPMDQEMLKVFFNDALYAVVMNFTAWSAVD
jgi:hypothetical protein